MKKIFLTVALVAGIMASAQVKIGDDVTNFDSTNSLLELESGSKGVLFPRVELLSTTDAVTVGSLLAGMTVYNKGANIAAGMYTCDGTAWVKLADSTGSLYGKSVRSITAGPIVWASNDLFIHLAVGYSGDVSFPSASANPGRIIGINNRSGGLIAIANTSGGNTGIYANENVAQFGASVGMVSFISDGTSWRLYAGRP